MSHIRIMLADDHEMFRKGVANLLAKEAEFDVVGEASDGHGAVRLASQLHPDVILMDVLLPSLDGVAATRAIVHEIPDAKILALTSQENEEYAVGMVMAGVKGYILKDAPFEELLLAVKTLAKGHSYFDKEVFPKLFSHLEFHNNAAGGSATDEEAFPVTEREMEVLHYIAGEYTNKEIAEKLFISPRTVETHRRNLIQKLKVKNTVGLVKYYLSHSQATGN